MSELSAYQKIEGLLLLISLPFLIFPTIWTPGSVISIFLLILVWLIQKRADNQPIFPKSPLNYAWLVWGIGLIIGIVVSTEPNLTWPKATNLFLGFAIWRYAVHTITTPYLFNIGLISFTLTGLGFAAIGLFSADWSFEVAFIERLLQILPPQLIQLPESAPIGIHTNQLAGTIAIYPPFFLALLLNNRRVSFITKAIMGILLILLVFLLLLTQSRGAWLAVFVGVLIVLVMNGFRETAKKRAIYWSVSGLIIVIAVGGLLNLSQGNLNQLWQEPPRRTAIGTFTTIEFRQEIWQWAISGIQDFPVTGVGLGSFREVVHRLYPIGIPSTSDAAHAHNIFLQVALDVGIIGLLGYLALVGLALTIAVQVATTEPKYYAWATGLLAGLVTLHVFGLLDALAPGSKTGILFWIMLGLLSALYRMTHELPLKELNRYTS